MRNKTQDDIVRQDQGFEDSTVVKRLRLPGIEVLHTKPTMEIAEVLANVLKSAQGITKIEFVLGKYIELTLEK